MSNFRVPISFELGGVLKIPRPQKVNGKRTKMDNETRTRLIAEAEVNRKHWEIERSKREIKEQRDLFDSRKRYEDYLTETLTGELGLSNARDVAIVVLKTLFDWNDVLNGEPCRFGDHPKLPTNRDRDFGFDCRCQQSRAEREAHGKEFLTFLNSFEPDPIAEARRAAEEAELQEWLATEPGVIITSHGGLAPEQWEGVVDGREFYFRERWASWSIEDDMQPVPIVRLKDVDADGNGIYEDDSYKSGTVIAEGGLSAKGYGETPLERAQFIIETIRRHRMENDLTVAAVPVTHSAS